MSQLIACPECSKHLQVPENLIGKKVQCPECKHTFTATVAEVEIAPARKSVKPRPPAESKTPAWDKKKRNDDDYEDDTPPRRRKRREDDDDEDDRDDRDDRPRRRRAPRYAPHRGGMILAFGIIGLVGGFIAGLPAIFGLIAWIMGNTDLNEMRAGRMDPEGESSTNVGRILGMVTVALTVVGLLIGCVFFCLFFGLIGAAAKANNNFPPPKRF
jgi:phage FluMu protein Com